MIDQLRALDRDGAYEGDLALATGVQDFLAAAESEYLSSLALALRLPIGVAGEPGPEAELRLLRFDREARMRLALTYLSDAAFERVSSFFLDDRVRDFLNAALQAIPAPPVPTLTEITPAEQEKAVEWILAERGSDLPSPREVLAFSPVHRLALLRIAPGDWRLPLDYPQWTEADIQRATSRLRNLPRGFRTFQARWYSEAVVLLMMNNSWLNRAIGEHANAAVNSESINDIVLYRRHLSGPRSDTPPPAFGLIMESYYSLGPPVYRTDDARAAVQEALDRFLDQIAEELTQPGLPSAIQAEPSRPLERPESLEAGHSSASHLPSEWQYVPYKGVDRANPLPSGEQGRENALEVFLDERRSPDELRPDVEYSVEWTVSRWTSAQVKTVRFTPRAIHDLEYLHERRLARFPGWITALKAGPARKFRQTGWKLARISPIPEFPNVTVQIKRRDTTVCLWGQRLSSDTIEFVAATDEH